LSSTDAELSGDFAERVLGFKVSDRTKGMVIVRCKHPRTGPGRRIESTSGARPARTFPRSHAPSTVADMIFPIPKIIAYVSTFTELAAGDVIATGTPGGLGAKRSRSAAAECVDDTNA
jgi:2-keto-4-pentenoate hydratase/2-oxohepta-3-ene-1,7-dioic acid hydratase in catechol pathway